MSEPFLAEIRMMGFSFPPRGWAFCDGQILPINQNQSLYSLLGTTYGGDGRTSFALPDLRGRTPIHKSSSHALGQSEGENTHTLSQSEMPSHNHEVMASTDGPTSPIASGLVWSRAAQNQYRAYEASNAVDMRVGVISPAGGGLSHNNMQPFLGLNFAIALSGLFPSRN